MVAFAGMAVLAAFGILPQQRFSRAKSLLLGNVIFKVHHLR